MVRPMVPTFAPVHFSLNCANLKRLLVRESAMRHSNTIGLALAATAKSTPCGLISPGPRVPVRVAGFLGQGRRAQEVQQAPHPRPPTPTITLRTGGPADPTLRPLPMPSGGKMHLLPATLETTQW